MKNERDQASCAPLRLPWAVVFRGVVFAQKSRAIFTDPPGRRAQTPRSGCSRRKGFSSRCRSLIHQSRRVGYGWASGALLPRVDRRAGGKAKESGRLTFRPDIYGRRAAATEERHQGGGGAFGMVTSRARRTVRWYAGGVARPRREPRFLRHQPGTDSPQELKLGYNLDGWISTQQLIAPPRRQRELHRPSRWMLCLRPRRRAYDHQRAPHAPRSAWAGARGAPAPASAPALRARLARQHLTRRRALEGLPEALFYSPDIGSDNKYETLPRLRLRLRAAVGGMGARPARLDSRAARGRPVAVLPDCPMSSWRGIPAALLPGTRNRRWWPSSRLRWERDAALGLWSASTAPIPRLGLAQGLQDADTVSSWAPASVTLVFAGRLGI